MSERREFLKVSLAAVAALAAGAKLDLRPVSEILDSEEWVNEDGLVGRLRYGLSRDVRVGYTLLSCDLLCGRTVDALGDVIALRHWWEAHMYIAGETPTAAEVAEVRERVLRGAKRQLARLADGARG